MFWYFHCTAVLLVEIIVSQYTKLKQPTKVDIVLQNDDRHYVPNISNAVMTALNRLLNAARAKAKKVSPLKCMLLENCLNMSGAG